MALLSSLWLAGCSVFGITGVAEPPYRVQARLGTIEIRHYGARIVAETTVQAGELSARSTGFRRVAAYIFGANRDQAKIAMTAPVAQAPDGAGASRIAFFMPADRTLRTLPRPNDAAVRLVTLPEQDVAVLRFSGLAPPAKVARQEAALLRGLASSAWSPSGAPVAWFYDPPWTLPPLRRNEVAVVVQARGQ